LVILLTLRVPASTSADTPTKPDASTKSDEPAKPDAPAKPDSIKRAKKIAEDEGWVLSFQAIQQEFILGSHTTNFTIR
jgi:hypothetical protein